MFLPSLFPSAQQSWVMREMNQGRMCGNAWKCQPVLAVGRNTETEMHHWWHRRFLDHNFLFYFEITHLVFLLHFLPLFLFPTNIFVPRVHAAFTSWVRCQNDEWCHSKAVKSENQGKTGSDLLLSRAAIHASLQIRLNHGSACGLFSFPAAEEAGVGGAPASPSEMEVQLEEVKIPPVNSEIPTAWMHQEIMGVYLLTH